MQLIRSNITTEQVSLIKVFRLDPNYLVGRAEWAVPAWEGLFLLLIGLPKEHSLTHSNQNITLHEVCFVVILFVFKEICLL